MRNAFCRHTRVREFYSNDDNTHTRAHTHLEVIVPATATAQHQFKCLCVCARVCQSRALCGADVNTFTYIMNDLPVAVAEPMRVHHC